MVSSFKERLSSYSSWLTIKPNGFVVYQHSNDWLCSEEKKPICVKNLEKRNSGLLMSNKSRKKLKCYLEWFAKCTKRKYVKDNEGDIVFSYQLVFITLTLPSAQIHSDNIIKSKCLNQFLVEVKKKFGVFNYVWKAELQSNGNIHFHITTDKYCDSITVRNMWNRIVNKLGYVDKFKKKYGHDNPNSTDVKAVRNIKNWAAYLSSYMCKDNLIGDLPISELMAYRHEKFKSEWIKQNGVIIPCPDGAFIEGSKWYVSKSIQNLKGITEYVNQSLHNEIEVLYNNDKVYKFQSEQCLYVGIDDFEKEVKKGSIIGKLYKQSLSKNQERLNSRKVMQQKRAIAPYEYTFATNGTLPIMPNSSTSRQLYIEHLFINLHNNFILSDRFKNA